MTDDTCQEVTDVYDDIAANVTGLRFEKSPNYVTT